MRARVVALVALSAAACCARPSPRLGRAAVDEDGRGRADAQRTRTVADAVSPPRALSAVKRLRGGEEDGVLGGLQRAYLGVPVVTRSWFSLVLALAALSQAGLVSEELVAVDAAAFARRFQLWRPFTAAAFLGGVGPQLLQKLYYGISFGKELERELGSPEFLRAAASCIAALTLLCHVLGWPHSADGLIMAVTLLACLQVRVDSSAHVGLARCSDRARLVPVATHCRRPLSPFPLAHDSHPRSISRLALACYLLVPE
jgi:hypothetical protein